ncbi:MAG: alkaline phosphatase family protein [Lentisphaerae bacterium]|nr:alkaline phosphatase family protein [Lentisphaerota bacterium]
MSADRSGTGPSRRDVLRWAGAAGWGCLAGRAAAATEKPKPNKLPGLDNLQMLGLWEEPPAAVRRAYEACHRILSAGRRATFADVAGDADAQRALDEAGLRLLGGPMLGGLRPDGASVWVRTRRPARVEVRVTAGGGTKAFGPVESTPETDLSAVVVVDGLEPGARHPYRVLVDGTEVPIPPHAAIATLPAAPAASPVRIAFGTCAHRFGLGNRALLDAIRARRPAAALLCGDIAVQDRNNHLGLHRADYLLRDFQPPWRDLVAEVPVYATWDDHDYFDNDQWGIPAGFTAEDRAGVWTVFRRSWAHPSFGFGDNGGGVFQRTRIGPCDVILTDGRHFREKGSLLGAEQMAWLERQLKDCTGPFVILESSTMWSDYVSNGKDSWGVYDPEGRERIFRLIETHRIPGVLLISGDRHGARGFRIPRPSGFAFHEFEPASLGGIDWGPPAMAPDRTQQLFGHLGYAFGEFEFNVAAADPTVTFRLVAQDGSIVHEMTLPRSRLTPPAG